MDALELTMKCSKLLQKPYLFSLANENANMNSTDIEVDLNEDIIQQSF